MEYTTPVHDEGTLVPEEEDDDDSVEGQSQDSKGLTGNTKWEMLRKELMDQKFDLDSPILSKLGRKDLPAVRIPRVGEPELISFTAYNMHRWGSCQKRWAFEVEWDHHDSWYPDYQFRALNHTGWEGKWERANIADKYRADIFTTNVPSARGKWSNQWWLQQTGTETKNNAPWSEGVVLDVHIIKLGPQAFRSAKLASPDLQYAVDRLREYAKRAEEIQGKLEKNWRRRKESLANDEEI